MLAWRKENRQRGEPDDLRERTDQACAKSDVHADDARAIAVYDKVGFVSEGVVRDALFVDGRYRDAIAMAIVHRGRAAMRRRGRGAGS
jgi:hypothetical protein